MGKHAEFWSYAGHIVTRTNRLTKSVITVYDAEQQQLDTEDGKYAIVCETHGSILNVSSQSVARSHMAYPAWCEVCRELLP